MTVRITSRGATALRTTLALLFCSPVPVYAADLNPNFSIDANIEINTDAIDNGSDSTEYSQSGRVEANLRGEIRSERYFVRGKGTLVLAKDSDTHTDDMWMMFGSERWDLQFGRFEAIDLFPKGKDTLVVNAAPDQVQVYQANLVRGRASSDEGQIALHLYGDSGFGFELATLFGDDYDDGTVQATGDNAISGVRPVFYYDGDNYSARIGYEYQHVDLDNGDKIENQGVGFNLSLAFGKALVNLDAAWLDDKTDFNNVENVQSYGANLVYGPFGIGLIYSKTDLVTGPDPSGASLYAAYTLPLFDIDNASVTFAVSGSQADNVTGDDSAYGGRLRFNYAF